MRLPFTILLFGLLVTAGPAAADWRKHIIGSDQGSYDTRNVDMDGDLDVLLASHSSKNLV